MSGTFVEMLILQLDGQTQEPLILQEMLAGSVSINGSSDVTLTVDVVSASCIKCIKT